MTSLLRPLALTLVLAMSAAPAFADKLSLNSLSRYLNAIQTATAKFTQINEDGTISTGTIYIKRPGRVRFEYDPPEQALVISNGSNVAVIDKKSNLPPEIYALDRTPLSIILARNVNLGQARMVTRHSFDGTATVVRAQDPDHPEYGHIELKFTGPDTELRQWIIQNENGSRTTVILGELTRAGGLANRLFTLPKVTGEDR